MPRKRFAILAVCTRVGRDSLVGTSLFLDTHLLRWIVIFLAFNKLQADWYTLHHTKYMAFEPYLKRFVADPCSYHDINGGVHFYLLAHVDDYAYAYLDPFYFEA